MKALAAEIVVACLAASGAQSHDWYESSCCSGRDCSMIEPDRVHASPKGYVVTLRPGDHPFVAGQIIQGLFRFVGGDPTGPYPMARRSGDSDFHACVSPKQTLLCLYAPDAGS